MGKAADRDSLELLLHELAQYSRYLLIESNIPGDEYSCPVLEYADGTVRALPPILIRPLASSFFDYTAKYAIGASEEIVPAPCGEELTERIKDTALRAHHALQCSGLTRTDIICCDNKLFTLEINTLPGLTPASLTPKAFAAAGGTFTQLLDIMIETAVNSRRRE